MKKALTYIILVGCGLFAGLVYGQSRNTYVIHIPLIFVDHLDSTYLRVKADSRIDALTKIGITVFTETEWDQICKSTDCSKYKVSERTQR